MERLKAAWGRWKWERTLVLCLLAAYSAVWMFTDKTPWMHTIYCSYALQARSWRSLQGRVQAVSGGAVDK